MPLVFGAIFWGIYKANICPKRFKNYLLWMSSTRRIFHLSGWLTPRWNREYQENSDLLVLHDDLELFIFDQPPYVDIFESNPDTLLKVAYILKDVLNARSELEKLNKQGEENNENNDQESWLKVRWEVVRIRGSKLYPDGLPSPCAYENGLTMILVSWCLERGGSHQGQLNFTLVGYHVTQKRERARINKPVELLNNYFLFM